MQTGSKELIRDINKSLVLTTIIEKGPISRAEIAKQLGLTKATVSAIVQTLLDASLVNEGTADLTPSVKGRRPIPLTFNTACGFIVSVNLDAAVIQVLVADAYGGHCTVHEYKNTYSAEEILPFLTDTIRSLRDAQPSTPHGLLGIALGIHGIVFKDKIVFTPYTPYDEIDFKTALESAFGVPCLLENEANLAAIGEHTFCYPDEDLINLSIHSGIGIGLFLRGRLYVGHSGFGGEFGHTVIVPDGRPCPCGNCGCIEQYASERAIFHGIAMKKGLATLSADDFARLLIRGDADAAAGMEDFLKYISIGVNNLIQTLDPTVIVINSSFTMNFPGLAEEIRSRLRSRMSGSCRIEASTLQDMAILLGGAIVVRNRFLGI